MSTSNDNGIQYISHVSPTFLINTCELSFNTVDILFSKSFWLLSPLLRANCFKSLWVFSSAAGHLETHRAMDLIFLLIKSRLQGSRKKTYLTGIKKKLDWLTGRYKVLPRPSPQNKKHFSLEENISIFGYYYASGDCSVCSENERWWHLLPRRTDPSL